MMKKSSRPAELVLPVASLAGLRRALSAEVGPDAAAVALRVAGHAAGDALWEVLRSGLGPQGVEQLGADGFWQRLSELFDTRGWGELHHEPLHAGVGALDAVEWVEADAGSGGERPSCHVTTGVLANLLGRAAEQELAVLEVECRSKGDLRCRFLFGAPETLAAVHRELASGRDTDASIRALG
jgi:predicted hydrocarbon binding protein